MAHVSRLQQLVRRFLSGGLDYAAFRAEFVSSFLSFRHDPAIEDLVNLIEGECSDFDERDISFDDLRSDLETLAQEPIIIAADQSLWVGLRTLRAPAQSGSGANLAPAREAA